MLICQNKDANVYPDNGISSEHRSVTEPKSRKTYKAKVVPTLIKNKKIKNHWKVMGCPKHPDNILTLQNMLTAASTFAAKYTYGFRENYKEGHCNNPKYPVHELGLIQ